MPFPTIVVDRLADIVCVEVPPEGALLALAVLEAFAAFVDRLSKFNKNTLAIVDFVAKVAGLADTNSSVELFAVRGDFTTDFVIIKDVVEGALDTLAINPSFTAKKIIEGPEKGEISPFNRGTEHLKDINL